MFCFELSFNNGTNEFSRRLIAELLSDSATRESHSVTVAGKAPVALTFTLDGTDATKATASFADWETPTEESIVTVEVSYNEIKRVKTYTFTP